MDSAQQPYLFPEYQDYRRLADSESGTRPREETAGRVFLHAALFVATALTTAITGAAIFIQSKGLAEGFLIGPLLALFRETAKGNFEPLAQGLVFTFTLLMILAAHEFGHYFACRYYGIRATLPFFIPAPPLITLFGTFGAVIRIKEPIYSRKALFDIGIAGPLAGFAFALPASFIGLMFATPELRTISGGVEVYQDPLLFVLIAKVLGAPPMIEWNPIYWATWGTLLVTALNLFPVGQLDGGHVLYAVVGRTWHRRVTLVTCGAVTSLAIYSWVIGQPPVYVLWSVVLLFLARVGHPPVTDESPLGAARLTLAVVAVLVFLLCFMPFPITT